MSQPGLSILILCRNASATIEQTLQSASFADEIVVLDDGSTDDSEKICRQYTSKILNTDQPVNFAQKRNLLFKAATHEWRFYLDSDEVITNELQKELLDKISVANNEVFFVRRRNFFLGKEMYEDKVERLFNHQNLIEWQGKVHEHPQLQPDTPTNTLKCPLLHYTHQSITTMLNKTNEWSEMEADLRLEAKHPPMAWWRLLRIGATVFYQQYWGKRLYRYGREGLFEAYYQMVDKLIVYTKLWEKQL